VCGLRSDNRHRFDSRVCAWHTLRMSKIEPLRRPSEPSQSDRAMEAIVSAIETLMDGLGAADKEKVLRNITEKLRPIPVPQAATCSEWSFNSFHVIVNGRWRN